MGNAWEWQSEGGGGGWGVGRVWEQGITALLTVEGSSQWAELVCLQSEECSTVGNAWEGRVRVVGKCSCMEE